VRATPDGYTLLMVGTAQAINATLYNKLNFHFIRDITPVAGLIRFPNVIVVNPSVPAKTVPEFIAYAKTSPGKINYASAGTGTTTHLTGELFKMMAGVNLVHVPYRGSAPALTDMISGQVHVMFDILTSSIQHIRSGALRALAVTSESRSEALRICQRSAISCRVMRQPPGMASPRPRIRRTKSSTSSTRRSTRVSLIRR
jgi:tripartite-type tricarboxylate transporter receptor subunit TctC